MENKKLSYNLQFFAEDDGTGADNSNGDGTEATKQENTSSQENTTKLFDDILANKEYQAEFDRRVQKAIQTAVAGEKEKWSALMDDKLSEAEKLSKMNKEEKIIYLQKKKEKELEERESNITKKELMAEAKNTLATKKIPTALAELLVYSDADTCQQSIKTLEKAWQEGIEQGVEERLKGGKPPKKAPNEEEKTQQEILNIMLGK